MLLTVDFNTNHSMEKKLKVLRVGMNYPKDTHPGGGQQIYYNSYCSNYEELLIIEKKEGILRENRPGVHIVEINQHEGSLGLYSDSFIKKIRSLFGKISSLYKFYKYSKKYIDDFRPEIVHLYTPIPFMCGLYAKRKYGSKVVISLHGSDMLRISKNKIYGVVLRIADAIVSVSDNTMSIEKNPLINKPIQYIGNGVDLHQFTNKHSKRENKFVHIGSLRWQKGQEYLINGFALFLQDHPDYELEIIGKGPRREELENLCSQLGIKDKVDFRGVQGRESIAESLNMAKAFVLTSVSEGFPKVIIEAMGTGTPVISSDAGNVKSVIMDSGIIFPKKSVEAVSMAMNNIIESKDKWINYSRLSEKYAAEYSWERQAEKLDNIYQELLKGKSSL